MIDVRAYQNVWAWEAVLIVNVSGKIIIKIKANYFEIKLCMLNSPKTLHFLWQTGHFCKISCMIYS